MKKTLLIASALVVTFGFTSCKKDWTCSCPDGNGGTIETTIPNTTKPLAKTTCEGSSLAGVTSGCSLK